jgi:hypothetical protein
LGQKIDLIGNTLDLKLALAAAAEVRSDQLKEELALGSLMPTDKVQDAAAGAPELGQRIQVGATLRRGAFAEPMEDVRDFLGGCNSAR